MVLRLAVYACPRPGTPWHRRSAAWMGRDSVTGQVVPRTDALGDGDLVELTASAAGYGFHATLRSPFRLADGTEVADCLAAVERVAATLAPAAPRLGIGRIGGFAAFVPLDDPAPLEQIERACVTGLDELVCPADDDELARRRRASLTERQDELLVRWGYPYVLDEFRYHMTLTRRLGDDEADAVLDAARHHFGELDGAAFPLDDLVVLSQTDGGPFVELTRVPLGHVLPD
ncbi:MAG: DUF1045 domain-containing protein [Actinomycetota bacterium]